MSNQRPMTMTEKILAAHAHVPYVRPGELILADVDLVLSNDITSPVSIDVFEKAGFDQVFDPDKITMVMDHFVPNKDIQSAQQAKRTREFCKKHAIKQFFDAGRMGIEHALLPERGMVRPGMIVIGADSHTCTYGAIGAFSTGVGSTDVAAAWRTGKAWLRVPEAIRFELKGELQPWVSGKDIILYIIGKIGVDGARYKSMEFTGPGVSSLSVDDRFSMANMAIEAGAKNGIFAIDEAAEAYVSDRTDVPYTVYQPDEEAEYSQVIEIDLSSLEVTVAFPHLPSNTRTFNEIKEDIPIHQVVIGSCTNGKLSDLAIAAELIKGKQVADGVRMIVIPATQKIYLEAVEKGYAQAFVEAGAVFSTPTCGPCLGGHMGILAENERCVATTNRNFVGRMGHPSSEVYLASPAVAAASAITGKITSPAELN
ncbi:3-isopropylmalate dehydratase large subunit [Peptococcus simiae]|uniref:3-isopropylmalate dehydratase large subunit n=1 Tax=Peptococcus simiae TaxID=1643805 RepID=A0ABW9H007_9FIRM